MAENLPPNSHINLQEPPRILQNTYSNVDQSSGISRRLYHYHVQASECGRFQRKFAILRTSEW